MNLSLEGRTALITGASRGIGRAIATRFADAGARVYLTARVPDTLAQALKSMPAGCAGSVADLTSAGAVSQLVADAVRAFGRIDVLVNNAGVFPVTPLRRLETEEWRRVLATNLEGPFLCSKLVAEHMIEHGVRGTILNVSSTSSILARPGVAHYASSKAGLNMLTRVLALELAPHGITVNALCPGVIDTETVARQARSAAGAAEHRAKLKRIPLGRLGTAEEVAATALFMVSGHARYMTGACVVLDGGYTIGIPAYEETE